MSTTSSAKIWGEVDHKMNDVFVHTLAILYIIGGQKCIVLQSIPPQINFFNSTKLARYHDHTIT